MDDHGRPQTQISFVIENYQGVSLKPQSIKYLELICTHILDFGMYGYADSYKSNIHINLSDVKIALRLYLRVFVKTS